MFIEVWILRHFDLECHIRIETDASSYPIREVLSQLISDYLTSDLDPILIKSDFGQWHAITYFSREMILAETRNETHNGEFLAIVEAVKSWKYYRKGCKYEVFVLTNYNNLCCFMDTKNLSFTQVRLAQELSRYQFWIDYRRCKANAAANALSRYPKRSPAKEKHLRAENTQIFHCI